MQGNNNSSFLLGSIVGAAIGFAVTVSHAVSASSLLWPPALMHAPRLGQVRPECRGESQ